MTNEQVPETKSYKFIHGILLDGFYYHNQLYNDALRLFHIEIRKVQKGNLIFVIDENGNPVRYSIKMSDYEGRP